MLDTNILILRRWVDPAELPDEMAISAITLAELSAGPHDVRRNGEQDRYDEHAERARRLEICSGPRASSTRSRSMRRPHGSTAGWRRPSSPRGASHGHESRTS
jgi:predicted nucleic acid-binding protein